MTELLQQAIAQIEKLSDIDQDAIATRFTATTNDQWDQMSTMVHQEIEAETIYSLELKLATVKDFLSSISSYERIICTKGYKSLSTNKHTKSLNSIRNSLEGEEHELLTLLKEKGIHNPREDFSFGEVKSFREKNTLMQSFQGDLNKISLKIFDESERIMIKIISSFDFTPEWIFPTSTMNGRIYLETVLSCKHCIDRLFIDILMNNERVMQTLENWKAKPKMSARIQILEEAINAHVDGKYYLSVSTLIPQVEGLLRDSLPIEKSDFDSMDEDDMKRATSALKDLWKSHSYTLQDAALLLESLPDAVGDLYETYNPPTVSVIKGKLYRHGVCHGRQTDFGSKKNSIRLILLLDRIIFFYAEN
jgi:hypothetical protein